MPTQFKAIPSKNNLGWCMLFAKKIWALIFFNLTLYLDRVRLMGVQGMQIINDHQHYGIISQLLHWIIGGMVIALTAVGFYMADLPNSPDKFYLYGLHKAFGITVLALMVVRILWRSINIQPKLPRTFNKVQSFLAHAAHISLYALVIVMTLSGWLMSSAAGYPVNYFGFFEVPSLIEKNAEIVGIFVATHFYAAWALSIMVGLHVLAALYHHFILKDRILIRMIKQR